jgi:signal transduction histidine kinase/ligand-binding sensor domain-containing protein
MLHVFTHLFGFYMVKNSFPGLLLRFEHAIRNRSRAKTDYGVSILAGSSLPGLTLALCVWTTGAASAAHSIVPEPKHPEPVIDMLHTSWTAREGVPAGITCITQTPDGWIWIGSKSGLYKFDGVRFIRAVGPDAPLTSNISGLGVLQDGRLWVGYTYGGFSLREGNRMRHFPADPAGLPTTSAWHATLDASGRLWLATADGLYYFDSRWRPANAAFGFPGGRVHSILLDRRGVLWARCETGLFALPKGATKFELKMGLTGSGALKQHPDGSVWTNDIRTNRARLVVGPERGPAVKWNAEVDYTGFVFDQAGYMWLATEAGVGRAAPAGAHMITQRTGRDHGLTGNIVSALFEDREQNVWVATESGLDRFRKPRLRALTLPTYTIFDGRPIAGGPDGSAWVDRFSVASADATPKPFVPDHGKVITALYRGMDGAVWGGGDGQLWRLDKTGLSRIPLPSGIPANQHIVSLTQDGGGALWANFGRKGVYQWAAGHWTIPDGLPKPQSVPARCIVTDAHGRIWLGFVNNQVALVDKDKIRLFGAVHGLSIGTVAQIIPLEHGAWVGGENGLSYFDGQRFTPVVGKGGEPFTGITGLVLGRDGTLWINGASGISNIARTELWRAVNAPGSPVRFDRLDYRDGLRGTAGGAFPLPSATMSDNGTLWFSTLGGVYAFKPESLPRNLKAPPVLITGMRSGAAEYEPVDGTHLPKGTEMLQVDFTALSYQAPERMEFRYRLDGVDTEWRESIGDRSAYYTNLSPGHYRFRVIASNNDGVWNNGGASIAFDIAPRLTQTIWFRSLCVAVLLNLLISIYFWRTRQLGRKYSEKLKERLEERERIARALHDTLLQSMQGLILRFHGAAKRLPSDDKARLGIEAILDQADLVMAEGRSEVMNLRTKPENNTEMEEALSKFGRSLQQDFGIEFRLKVSGDARPLRLFAWQEIHCVGREALFNAYQHAHATLVEVEIHYGRTCFTLSVRDNGIGMDGDVRRNGQREGHWGLAGMKERANTLHGSLELWSRDRKGTEIRLRIPAVHAYDAPKAVSAIARLRAFSGR